MLEGTRDPQTVDADSRKLIRYIAGVQVRFATTHLDDRGELCEIYNPAWGFDSAPLVYVYQTSVRPGKLKGWVYHKEQDDRLFASFGSLRIVLFDMRDDSDTKGMINEIELGERRRGLVLIPKLVAHAVQNIGNVDATFVNLPSKPYNHANPDKYRIPIGSGQIPYEFESSLGR